METPDSIYIFTDGDERWYDVKEWEGRTPPPANVEYIRKDALLEWAKEKKAELLDEELTDVAAGINMGMDMLIYKLEQL